MKKSILILATIAALATCFPVTTRAATQVYDLKADWNDTQNPNGAWSYRSVEGTLLLSDPFPWITPISDLDGFDSITKTTAGNVVPGYLEVGDISVLSFKYADVFSGLGTIVRWTAPATGTIDVSGGIWRGSTWFCWDFGWTLRRNGNDLNGGAGGGSPRSSPDDFSSGSAGANGLLNIAVQAGDQVELALIAQSVCESVTIGLNFTITLTPDSVDPVAAIEDLAIAVFDMNLQNGIENSLDSKLDAALNALVDANVNNDGAACNSLAAFISAVEAQRGKKITSVQADQLIAAAREIQAMLNCGN